LSRYRHFFKTKAEPEEVASAPAPTRAEPIVQSKVEAKKKKSIWSYSIGGGLVFAALAALPRLVNLIEISDSVNQGLLSELAFSAALQDLAFRFVVNWAVWALVIAGLMAIWRAIASPSKAATQSLHGNSNQARRIAKPQSKIAEPIRKSEPRDSTAETKNILMAIALLFGLALLFFVIASLFS